MNIKAHNREIIRSATSRAEEMISFPSPLEERMISLLNKNNIFFEFQKIFYIRAKDGYILRYYIADFYVPDRAIIIEVDGKFHDKHKIHDKMRTRYIQEQYPEVSVLRYKWADLSDEKKMEDLVSRLKG